MALLALLVGLAYGNSLGNGFAFDDAVMIEHNALITRAEYLPRLLTSDYWAGRRDPSEHVQWRSGLYRPLVLASFALNYAVGRLDPFGYHLLNVLLHILVTWLVFSLALQAGFTVGSATVGAALFAVHPVHTEAVTGIVGRAELLMAVGVLGSLWWANRGRIGPSVLSFAAGLLSKEQAVVLPVLLVLNDVCTGNSIAARSSWKELVLGVGGRYGWHVLALASYLLVRALMLGRLQPPPVLFLDNPIAHVDGYTQVLSAVKVAGLYLALFVWPAVLSADYSYDAIPIARSLGEPGVILATVAWGSLLGLACWAFKRDRRPAFCVGLLVMTFVPVSNMVIPIGTMMGERLFYLPSAGLCLLLGLVWERCVLWEDRDRLQRQCVARAKLIRFGAGGTLLLICLGLLVRTALRNRDWADTESLFRSAAQAVPTSAKAKAVLGDQALAKGEWEQALRQYQTATDLYPAYTRSEVTINLHLGMLFMKLGRWPEATEAFERAVVLDPESSGTQYHLGIAYAAQASLAKAEAALRTALILNPEHAESLIALSAVLVERGSYTEALAQAEAALRRLPGSREASYHRARALKGLGREKEADAEFRRAAEGMIVPGLIGSGHAQ
jgi:Tfp pilus assembly protein PilF